MYGGNVSYDSAQCTTITMVKLGSDLNTRTTPHASVLRASYGVYFVSYMYTKKDDRDISRAHCISMRWSY